MVDPVPSLATEFLNGRDAAVVCKASRIKDKVLTFVAVAFTSLLANFLVQVSSLSPVTTSAAANKREYETIVLVQFI